MLYDIKGNTIIADNTNVSDDTLIGTLPQKIEGRGYYMKATSATTVETSGLPDLYERYDETLIGSPIDVTWGENSLSYTSGTNACGVYTRLNGWEAGKTYTLFGQFESGYIGVLAKANEVNTYTGSSIGQMNSAGYMEFTIPGDTKYLNLSFASSGTSTPVSFTDLHIVEGQAVEIVGSSSLSIKANTEYDCDAFIGMTLTGNGVSLYKRGKADDFETDDGGVIIFADSIFDFSTVAFLYRKHTGKSVLDCAVGGTRLSGSRDSTNDYYPYDMTQIADSIANGDFSTQIDGGKNSMFGVLEAGNIANYKAIILALGTNDFTAGVTFEGTDKTTIQGALKHVIESIWSKYPNMRIVVLSTLQFVGQGIGSAIVTHTDGTVWQMNEIIKSICENENYCVPFVDMYHTMGENPTTRAILTSDGVHLSGHGSKRYSDILIGTLNALGI